LKWGRKGVEKRDARKLDTSGETQRLGGNDLVSKKTWRMSAKGGKRLMIGEKKKKNDV